MSGKAKPAASVGSSFRNRSYTHAYDANGNAVDGSGVPSHYVRKRVYGLGPVLEANYDNAAASGAADWKLKKVRLYVSGPDGTIGAREFDVTSGAAGTEKTLVYHHDHLGSTQSITPWGVGNALAANATGESGRYSEDPWGARRNPFTWTGVPPANTDNGGAQGLTPRGFTGHEMLDDLGLVHMNGRIYDPLLGRFLSADLIVQNPSSLQDYNRYSYVRNNPLSLTDPSGFATISDYEEKIKKLREEGAAARKAAYEKDGVWGLAKNLFSKENRERGAQIIEAQKGIEGIQEHASNLQSLAGVKVDAKKLDDVSPVYQLQQAGLRFFQYVPFASVGGKAVNGDVEGAAKDAAIQGGAYWLGRKVFGSSPNAGSTAAAEVAETTAARVNLEASEKLGGHLLAKHVGKTDAELMSRALTDPTTRGVASSFFDRASADAAVTHAIDANSSRISAWLADKSSRLTIETTMESAVGRVITSEGGAISSQSARIVLEKNSAAQSGYIVKTGFPF